MAKLRLLTNRIREIEFPVLRLEMRIRQRKARPFIVMGVYAGVLSILVIALFATWPGGPSPGDLSRLGEDIFMWMSLLQVSMVCLIVPAYSAMTVSAERDRRTFDLLAITLLPTWAIVVQKLAAAVAEIVMLLAASLPVLAVVFMLGGISPLQVAEMYGVLLVAACTYGALGVLCSCVFKDSRTSIFAAYLTTMVLIVGVPAALVFLGDLMRGSANALLGFTDLVFYQAAPVSFVVFGVASWVMSRIIGRRANWVIPLGLSYMAVILVLLGTGRIWSAVTSVSAGDAEAFTIANPLRAASEIVDSYKDANEVLRFALSSVGISISYAYVCQWLSVRRLDRLRRS